MPPTRTLVLMRHAKAEAYAGSDAARPLALAGRRQALAAGEQLAASGVRLDAALVSAAVRTRQTWELLASRIPDAPTPRFHDDLYDATARTALDVVRAAEPEAATLIVVGHEPVMSSLAVLLHGEGGAGASEVDGAGVAADLAQIRVGIPTATRCVLTFEGEWADLVRGGAVLRAVQRTPAD